MCVKAIGFIHIDVVAGVKFAPAIVISSDVYIVEKQWR